MVEYGSTPYMMFMLGEYVAIALMCALTTISSWAAGCRSSTFRHCPGCQGLSGSLKAFGVFFMFSMVKAFVPRYRYDQLMRLGWKVFLPLSLAMVVLVAAFLQFTGTAP
jgi:NADH-quinone oxidoreductase subunit H